jgi:hypothetical protein
MHANEPEMARRWERHGKMRGKLTVINGPEGPRVAKLTAKMGSAPSRMAPAEALYVAGHRRRAGELSQRCDNCAAYGDGRCDKLRPTGKLVGRARVDAKGYCSLWSPSAAHTHKSTSPKTIVPVERLRWRGNPKIIQVQNVTTLGVLAKAGRYAQVTPTHGSSPRWETPPIPDFQDIYFQPESDKRNKLQREHQENRRMAVAQRNAGVYGFHGEVNRLDRQLRYEPAQSLSQPLDVVDPQRLGRRSKAILVAPKLAPRLNAGATTFSPADDDDEHDETKPKRKRRKKLVARRS